MMRYKLVIAEKPSVAQSLAAVIGATARKDGYLEGNGWRVSWCVGHLAGLADADSYDPKYAKCGARGFHAFLTDSCNKASSSDWLPHLLEKHLD